MAPSTPKSGKDAGCSSYKSAYERGKQVYRLERDREPANNAIDQIHRLAPR